jgi:hypothetical protein
MYQPWNIDGKSGNIQYPKGEVVCQNPKRVEVRPVYVTSDEKYYIEENGKLIDAPMNPFNGYCYRQDGL